MINYIDTHSAQDPKDITVEGLHAIVTTGDVAYLQLRVAYDGQWSPWFRAEVHDGRALVNAALTVRGMPSGEDADTESKAFDRFGREVPIR